MVFEKNTGHCAILYFVKYLVKYKIHKCILYFKYICKKYCTKYFELLFTIVFRILYLNTISMYFTQHCLRATFIYQCDKIRHLNRPLLQILLISMSSMGSCSKTKSFRKAKIGANVPRGMSDWCASFQVKRSKVRLGSELHNTVQWMAAQYVGTRLPVIASRLI